MSRPYIPLIDVTPATGGEAFASFDRLPYNSFADELGIYPGIPSPGSGEFSADIAISVGPNPIGSISQMSEGVILTRNGGFTVGGVPAIRLATKSSSLFVPLAFVADDDHRFVSLAVSDHSSSGIRVVGSLNIRTRRGRRR